MNKTDDWFERLFRKKGEIKKQIMSNDDYIKWIISALGYNDVLDQELEMVKHIRKGDLEKIENLDVFFDAIDDYARRNYISEVGDLYACAYNIKYNDIGLQIGINGGQGSSCYCVKLPISDDKRFIDFNDILTNKEQPVVPYIKDFLNGVSKSIESAYRSGAPIYVIRQVVEDTMSNLRTSESDISKTLSRENN